MKATVVFSVVLHGLLVAAMIFYRPGPNRFEGYPVVIPVELVELKPVSFNSPQVESVAPRQQVVKPRPKTLEGVTVEKPRLVEEEPEPKPKPIEKKETEEDRPAVKSDKVRLDVKEFPFSYYLALLQSRIQANWEPPVSSAAVLGKKTVVFFRIQRNGRLTDILIETGSGDYLFDQAALRAVTLANPLPPLPFDFPEPSLGVHFEFAQGR